MHLLQVCNVGEICGGTAACAWTITRALPDWKHSVLFLSKVSEATRQAFSHCDIFEGASLTKPVKCDVSPDLVLLHNTAPDRMHLPDDACSVLYAHSVANHQVADIKVACSQHLAAALESRSGAPCDVLYQPVPIPPYPFDRTKRTLSDRLVIGRICTPTQRKWPHELLDFYSHLANSCPQVDWEFVGAPPAMQKDLASACQQNAHFWPAGFTARSHLWNWHALLYHHPTLTETFGRTVAESMRAGCVPIVDARGGFLEQITSGENGFLCASSEDFGNAIQSLSEPGSWRAVSSQAKFLADQRFSLSQFRDTFEQLLLKAV